MKPVDIRNESFESLRARLDENRARVHTAWLEHGPATTRQLADKSRIDLLTLRPRTTELYQIGAIALLEQEGHEGIYQARTIDAWEAWHRIQRETPPAIQQQLL